ncbi:MAG: hypothetical protein VB858_06520 [Planctomycetaceae bacterium]
MSDTSLTTDTAGSSVETGHIPEPTTTELHDVTIAPPAETTASQGVPEGTTGSASDNSGTRFLALNLILAAGFLLTGVNRHAVTTERVRPTPVVNPELIGPRHDDPDVVSDDVLQAVLHQLRPSLRGKQPKINHVDHALRFWGTQAVFDDPDCLSGIEMLQLLTDHRHFQESWGEKTDAFLLPNTKLTRPYVEFRTRSGSASSSHIDHTLATLAESGTPLDFPLLTPQGELPVRAAFDFAFDRFRLNQAEYEWSILAFLHYLPELTGWYTREGQYVTWDMLADRLMRERLTRGSCYGTHRLHTLACLLCADDTHQMLSPGARQTSVAFLSDVTQRLIATQNDDGYWTADWPGQSPDKDSDNPGLKLDLISERLLATGHVLEWWALAPEEVLPERDRIIRAAHWLTSTIQSMSPAEIRRNYTFLTHAGRALSFWRGRHPSDIYQPPVEQEQPVEAQSAEPPEDVE